VAWYGLTMNTQAEIQQAVRELQSGRSSAERSFPACEEGRTIASEPKI
jgi:hypothetical protein